MSFLSGAMEFLSANPEVPIMLGSLLGGSVSNAAGGLGNAAMQGMDAQSEIFQVGMYAEQLRHQEQMQVMSQSFDEMMDEKSENMREQNILRDVQMAQRKADDAITKKFIETITQ